MTSSSRSADARRNARSVAAQVLRDIQLHGKHADHVLAHWLSTVTLNRADRALTHDLVYGVLRHRDMLDWRLNAISHRPVHRFPMVVTTALRLGAYQMICLDKIPASAAVNESVKLVRGLQGRDWKALVNGVLRNLSRQTAPPWPDETQDPVRALSIRYSCPAWMVERWLSCFGLDLTRRLCQLSTQIPPMTLRANTLRISRDDLVEQLRQSHILARPTTISPVGVVIDHVGSLEDLPALQQGLCYVEDEAAQLIPYVLDVSSGHRVWDVCAAPGGKTTHLAAIMKNEGMIVASDSDARRLGILKDNCRRLGITNVLPVVFNALGCDEAAVKENPGQLASSEMLRELQQGFDRILVDAPCSALGTLRRHPEAKWNRKPDQFTHYQALQRRLLDRVSHHLRPGGVLVYSACTVEPEESDQVIASFLRDHSAFRHDVSTPWLPPSARSLVNQDGNVMTISASCDMDGFFAARLRKVHP